MRASHPRPQFLIWASHSRPRSLLSPHVLMHGGLLYIIFCLVVRLYKLHEKLVTGNWKKLGKKLAKFIWVKVKGQVGQAQPKGDDVTDGSMSRLGAKVGIQIGRIGTCIVVELCPRTRLCRVNRIFIARGTESLQGFYIDINKAFDSVHRERVKECVKSVRESHTKPFKYLQRLRTMQCLCPALCILYSFLISGRNMWLCSTTVFIILDIFTSWLLDFFLTVISKWPTPPPELDWVREKL